MAEVKTVKTKASVTDFVNAIDDTQRRVDAKKLLAIFKSATGMKPAMWGTSIIGYGSYHYKSDRSTQEGDWPLVAFSPRKTNFTVYIMPGVKKYPALVAKLGPCKISGGSCLYIKRMSDIHEPTLALLITKSVKDMQKKYATTS